MLNERQDELLNHFITYDITNKDNRALKKHIYIFLQDDFPLFYNGNFNSSAAARIMSDDFLAITMDQNNPYIVVSSKSGVYITDCIEEKDAYILRLRDEANAKHKLASDIARLPLNGQIRVVAL
jgi:hypothetical protein